MNSLSQYILEKLHLNKDIKVNHIYNKEYYYIVPFWPFERYCDEHYKDYKVDSNNEWFYGWLLSVKDLMDLLKKFEKDISDRNICIYEIPDKYDTTLEFKKDVESNKLKIENLHRIRYEELKSLYI